MINVSTLFHFFWVFFHISVPRTFATEKFINHYLSILSMKILNFWTVALMALSFSTTFVSCGDDNDINLAKEIAGTYNGYSVGECDLFSDYLLGDQSSATITGNEDGSINLVYKSGSGDFRLNNLKLSSKSFSGSGEVVMSMGSGTGSSYNYTLEGSVNESKVLTLKTNVDIPTPMGEMEIVFMQGETPITYNIAATYQYNSSLSISVGDTSYGTTDECKAVIKRVSDTTVDITLSGFANLSGAGGHMSLGNFTISGVNVTAGANGTYSLSLGEYESTDSNGKAITGESLSGTIAADGTATINTDFKPGSMPIAISTVFTGSDTASAK